MGAEDIAENTVVIVEVDGQQLSLGGGANKGKVLENMFTQFQKSKKKKETTATNGFHEKVNSCSRNKINHGSAEMQEK